MSKKASIRVLSVIVMSGRKRSISFVNKPTMIKFLAIGKNQVKNFPATITKSSSTLVDCNSLTFSSFSKLSGCCDLIIAC